MSCSNRGKAASCKYSNDSPGSHDRRDGESKASEAQQRLQKLEEMVTSLMRTNKEGSESGSVKIPLHNATVDQCFDNLSVRSLPPTFETSSTGHLDVNGSETNYLGATHWATILENVGVPLGRGCS